MKAKVILEVSMEEFKDWQKDILEFDGVLPTLEEFKEMCIEHFFADRGDYLDEDYTTVYLV